MRLVLLTYESPHANLITQGVLERHAGETCGIVHAVAIERGRPAWQSVWRIARRADPRFVAWKAAEALVSRAAWLRGADRGGAAIPSLHALARRHGVPLIATTDVDDPVTLARLRAWAPDLMLSVHFNHRLGPGPLGVPALGVLNVHGSLLPRNRGLFPPFWALADGDVTTGVSIHWIDAALDTGDVLVQRELPIAPHETVGSLAWRCAELGRALALEALTLVSEGRASRATQPDGGTYRTWPTRADVRRLHARGRRLGGVGEVWRRLGA